jgi:hypothetical protein
MFRQPCRYRGQGLLGQGHDIVGGRRDRIQ